ncbi:Nn.00g010980.m01.CDS01 [Neocucurbitaria sp. VM-36]
MTFTDKSLLLTLSMTTDRFARQSQPCPPHDDITLASALGLFMTSVQALEASKINARVLNPDSGLVFEPPVTQKLPGQDHFLISYYTSPNKYKQITMPYHLPESAGLAMELHNQRWELAAARADRRRMRQTGTSTVDEDLRLLRTIRRCRALIAAMSRAYRAAIAREVNFQRTYYPLEPFR